MADEVRVQGLDGLKEAFRAVPMAMRKSVLRKALTAGARIVRDEAKRLAPVLKPENKSPYRKPGTVRKAIKVRTSKAARREGNVGVFVNVKPLTKAQIKSFKGKNQSSGYKNPDDPFYWQWLEFGRKGRGATAARQRVARVKKTVNGKTVELVNGVRYRRALRAVGPIEPFAFLRGGAKLLPQSLKIFERDVGKWLQTVNETGKVTE